MKKQILISTCFVVAVCFSSCVKNDLGDINEPTYYTPEYSIPIGSTEIIMSDLVKDYSGTLVEVPDTVSLPDSIANFIYNNIEYYSPRVFYYNYESNFDFSSVSSDMEYITSLMFRTNCENSIPASAIVQIYFLDISYNLIDSLYKDGELFIPAAATNDNGIIVNNGELWKHDTYYDTGSIQNLKDTKHIIIAAQLGLSDISNKTIQYHSEQKIWFQLGLRVGMKIPF